MNLNEELIYNVVTDFKRKEIDKHTKAQFLRESMKELKLSRRDFAKIMDIPDSTLKDWLIFDKLEPHEIEDYKKRGLNDTQIFRVLRNTKKKDVKRKLSTMIVIDRSSSTTMDLELERSIDRLKKYVLNPPKSNRTKDLLNELENMLKIIYSRVDKR